jgi:class 3 adenylate cyclase
MATINESLFEQRLAELEAVCSWSPRVISKLETFIRTSDDYALFRINPIHYATEKNMAAAEAISLFLYATKIGLVEIEWHMVCAYCAHVFQSLSNMEALHSHFICSLCDAENNISLDDYIQVAFTISPQVCQIRFHDPDGLSIEEYSLQYHFAKGIAPLADGSRFEDVLPLIVRGMFFLQPQEKSASAFDLTPGRMHALDIRNKTGVTFILGADPHPDLQVVPLQSVNGKLMPVVHPTTVKEIVFPSTTLKIEQYSEINSGKITFEISNRTEQKIPIWFLHYPPAFVPFLIPFEPFLSGKHLLTNQTFRDLFRSETVKSEEGLAIQDITFLFTDLKGSTAMYDEIGDPKAYFLVRQHFDTLGRVIGEHAGAIVKTIGDAVMATFSNPQDALAAGIAMLREIDVFNQTISQKLILKIGIHRGHSIAVTLNDRVDFFGQTVNIAARVQALADADEIYFTHAVFDRLNEEELLAGCKVVSRQVAVKGVAGTLEVYQVSLEKNSG